MHSDKLKVVQSKSEQDDTDHDVPMIESFYDDGDDLKSRFIVHGLSST